MVVFRFSFRPLRLLLQSAALAAAAACAAPQENAAPPPALEIGHSLVAARQYEAALKAFNRAALREGLTGEVLAGMGAANLGLGRLGQAEDLLRRAAEAEPDWPENLNNLGVVLLERGKTAEAERYLRKAFALDNGESDAIRDNLRLALAKMEKTDNNTPQSTGYELVPQSGGSYLLSRVQ